MANSPIDDPVPYQSPASTGMEARPEKKSDFLKLAKSKQYKEVVKFMDTRIEYHRLFLPGGIAPEQVKDEDVAAHWKLASMLISEYELFKSVVNGELNHDEAVRKLRTS
jgi:hypothetical protein